MADLIDRAEELNIVQECDGLYDAINALPTQGWRVKPLVWEDVEAPCTRQKAAALGGHYSAVEFDAGTDDAHYAVNIDLGGMAFVFILEPDLEWGGRRPKRFPTLDAAKAAAQADYERRVLAALPTQGWRVKPLVWKEHNDGNHRKGEVFSTRSPVSFAPIAAHKKHDGWWLNVDCKTYPTLNTAKAAAQADYEARILAALEPAEQPVATSEAGGVEGLQTAGRDMLALHDGFLSGADVDRPAANRLHLAASFGAQAFAVCPIPDARPAAMIRAIALALIDPMHSDLDYLRRVNMARPVEAPMMTDLMVDPENIDDFLAANPLPPTHVGDSEQPETAINAAPVDVLVKAAEPFAYEIDAPAMEDDRSITVRVTIGDHRRLRAALAALEPAEQPVATSEAGGVEVDWGADVGREVLPSPVDAGGVDPSVLAELPEVRALIRQSVDKAVRIVMDEVGYEEDDLCEKCRDSLAAIREGRNG